MIPSAEHAAPTPADILFVFAGAEHRKRFAVEEWRRGRATTLVVSVARFEWRRVPSLGLPGDGGLVALVEATPPVERLFQLVVTVATVEARRVPKGHWGTWNEALGIAALVRERRAASLLVCTSDEHLPRALLSVRRALARDGGPPCVVTGLAVPAPGDSSLAPSRRWRSPGAWAALILERVKFAIYAAGIPMLFDRGGPAR